MEKCAIGIGAKCKIDNRMKGHLTDHTTIVKCKIIINKFLFIYGCSWYFSQQFVVYRNNFIEQYLINDNVPLFLLL